MNGLGSRVLDAAATTCLSSDGIYETLSNKTNEMKWISFRFVSFRFVYACMWMYPFGLPGCLVSYNFPANVANASCGASRLSLIASRCTDDTTYIYIVKRTIHQPPSERINVTTTKIEPKNWQAFRWLARRSFVSSFVRSFVRSFVLLFGSWMC